jgi:hypothetical protein
MCFGRFQDFVCWTALAHLAHAGQAIGLGERAGFFQRTYC